MDQNFRQVTVWVGWQISRSAFEDEGAAHEQDFDEFAKFVVRSLQHRAAVEPRTIYSAGRSMRQVKFSASTPLTVERVVERNSTGS